MKATFTLWNKSCSVDFSAPISIHLPLNFEAGNPQCFYIEQPTFAPLRVGSYVGSVAEGGSCNCEVLTLTPHGQGTHTECVGHLTTERRFIRDSLSKTHFTADLISVTPEVLEEDIQGTTSKKGDQIITKSSLEQVLWAESSEAIIPFISHPVPQNICEKEVISIFCAIPLRLIGRKMLVCCWPTRPGGIIRMHPE
jgi:hypothetical protein